MLLFFSFRVLLAYVSWSLKGSKPARLRVFPVLSSATLLGSNVAKNGPFRVRVRKAKWCLTAASSQAEGGMGVGSSSAWENWPMLVADPHAVAPIKGKC